MEPPLPAPSALQPCGLGRDTIRRMNENRPWLRTRRAWDKIEPWFNVLHTHCVNSPQALPSNRSFGLLFTVLFALLGGYAWWRGQHAYPWWLAASATVLATTLLRPGWLMPFNRAWMKLAELLNRVVSPLVLGIIFFGLFAPIGVMMRARGRDVLKRRFQAEAPSYWEDRNPPGPDPASLPHPF